MNDYVSFSVIFCSFSLEYPKLEDGHNPCPTPVHLCWFSVCMIVMDGGLPLMIRIRERAEFMGA